MIAIACVGLLAGCIKLWMRRMAFLETAAAHASRAYDYGENRMAGCWREEFIEVENSGRRHLKKEFADHLDEMRDYFSKLEQKYRYAASHPWFRIDPDPPLPLIDRR